MRAYRQELLHLALAVLTCRFWEELHETINRVSLDPEVRVIVFASALEKIFTAGLDRELKRCHTS